METVIVFLVVVAVRLIDPLTLVMAGAFGAVAAYRKTSESRWLTIGLGTAAIVAVMATLAAMAAARDGQIHWSFPALSISVASLVQISVVCWAIMRGQSKREAS